MNFGNPDLVESSASSMSFKPGINEGVKLTKFEFTSLDTPNFTGKVFDIEFTKDGSTLRNRVFEPDGAKPFDNESQEDAERRVANDIHQLVASVVAAYMPMEFSAAINDVISKSKQFYISNNIQSFHDSLEFYIKLLNQVQPNFKDVEGKVIAFYDRKGYLSVPRYLWENGRMPFFTVKGDLQIANRLKDKLTKQESNVVENDTFDAF